MAYKDKAPDIKELMKMSAPNPAALDQLEQDADFKTCVFCFKEIGEFRDEKSKTEYEISAMCQDCQDETFGA